MIEILVGLKDNIFGFFLVFNAGVLTSFTPCIYPLIPITLAVIGAKATKSKLKGFFLSLIYVFGMSLTYALLGIFAALTGKVFGFVVRPALANFIVANVCLLSSFWIFGIFDLPTPKIFKNPKIKDKNFFWIFIIGVLSGLVVSPCVSPILISILSIVAKGENVAWGMSLLFVYGYGLGFTLILAGTFAGFFTNLPKSGRWLKVIKYIYGFILIATAEYFFIQCGKLLI